MMLTRRGFGSSAAILAGGLLLPKLASAAAQEKTELAGALSALELSSGGRLGVCLLDTKAGVVAHHRGDERFPMCSTFKVLAAAATLKGFGNDLDQLDQRVRFEQADLVENSPVTREHVGAGMSLRELCDAALTRSDNTAGNLLLKNIGGPSGLTSFARSLGDSVTRLDRIETALNEAVPGDPRDTTTPNAMAANFQRLIFGEVLPPDARELLVNWLVANKTGDSRLRAGIPSGWRVGDKTGAGDNGTTNDVAIIWPPSHSPVVVSVYLTGAKVDANARNEMIASVGRIVTQNLR